MDIRTSNITAFLNILLHSIISSLTSYKVLHERSCRSSKSNDLSSTISPWSHLYFTFINSETSAANRVSFIELTIRARPIKFKPLTLNEILGLWLSFESNVHLFRVLTLRNIFCYALHTIFLFYAFCLFSSPPLSNIGIVVHSIVHQIKSYLKILSKYYHKSLVDTLS